MVIKLFAALVLAMSPGLALAADYTLKLSDQEIVYVEQLLVQQPIKDALPLLQKVQGQIVQQSQPPAAPEPPKSPEPEPAKK